MREIQRIQKTALTGGSQDAKQLPADTELIKLRSTISDLSDVLEAHAVHGDHSDAQLQEWANVGRRAINDYREEKS